MRFGIAAPNWGACGDPRFAAELASAAEEAGWDGYFVWDGLIVRKDPPPVHDPWVILAAVAGATERVRIGTCIAVVPRYKPHLLAMRLASLDILSGGRMTLGVGLGDTGARRSFEAFGEPADPRTRAEMLDEGLDLIVRLWSGEEVVHRGKHYVVDGFALTATPLQKPRIPIWVGGDSAPAIRRAARWDGWIGPDANPLDTRPQDVSDVGRRLQEAGAREESFDIAWAGRSASSDGDLVGRYGANGATWWIEVLLGEREAVAARVAEGPPTGEA